MSEGIQTIVMPKWGLAMQEGMLAAWHVEPGTEWAAVLGRASAVAPEVFSSTRDG